MNLPHPAASVDDAYATVTEARTVRLQRLLPGPAQRVWDFLTRSELRRQWLAAGDMPPAPGTPFTLTWRNDELSDPPGTRPEGFGEEHRMECTITELDPPYRLGFTWGRSGGVSIALAREGKDVRLTLVHRRLPDRGVMLMVGAGWHAHLDLLVARRTGATPAPHWDHWARLKGEYDKRLPG